MAERQSTFLSRSVQLVETLAAFRLHQGGPVMRLEQPIDNYVRETKFPRSLFLSEDGRIAGV